MIKTTSLFYNYDSKFSALYDVNLKIENNTIVLSDELSSKTLFRVISKQDTDYVGEIFINNKNIKQTKFKDLSIAYITKPPYLLNNKTVTYNIAYPLIIRKENKKEALQKASLLMKEYKLKENKVKNCTNFEKLRISLIRTLIRHPQTILIDDIFTNLNDVELSRVLDIINSISKESLVVIALNNNHLLDKFKDYNIIKLFNGSLV